MITVWKGAVLALGIAVVGNTSEVEELKETLGSDKREAGGYVSRCDNRGTKRVRASRVYNPMSEQDALRGIDEALEGVVRNDDFSQETLAKLVSGAKFFGKKSRRVVVGNRLMELALKEEANQKCRCMEFFLTMKRKLQDKGVWDAIEEKKSSLCE